MSPFRVIGLTGGICSGKSTVGKFLRDKGIEVIDADILGHRVYEKGSATHQAVVEAFGTDVLAADGTIDRRMLGSKVFGKGDALSKLSAITWPGIEALTRQEIAKVRQGGAPVVVLEAAVLIEAGWQSMCDEVWVVVASPARVKQRLMARNSLDEASAVARINSQMQPQERVKHATYVIENESDVLALERQLEHLIREKRLWSHSKL